MNKCKLCFNCLTEGFHSKECTKNFSCKECGRKHSSILIFFKSPDNSKITDTILKLHMSLSMVHKVKRVL